jgi:hypothetical protein
MTYPELTEFQSKCEQKLLDRLARTGRAILDREVVEGSETYITGTIEGTRISFWIYDDGADFKSSGRGPMFEKPDYKSLDDLADDFVASIGKEIEKATEQGNPADRLRSG